MKARTQKMTLVYTEMLYNLKRIGKYCMDIVWFMLNMQKSFSVEK